jgi:hypothetical protein
VFGAGKRFAMGKMVRMVVVLGGMLVFGSPAGGQDQHQHETAPQARGADSLDGMMKCKDFMGSTGKMGLMKHTREEMTKMMEICRQMMQGSTPSPEDHKK